MGARAFNPEATGSIPVLRSAWGGGIMTWKTTDEQLRARQDAQIKQTMEAFQSTVPEPYEIASILLEANTLIAKRCKEQRLHNAVAPAVVAMALEEALVASMQAWLATTMRKAARPGSEDKNRDRNGEGVDRGFATNHRLPIQGHARQPRCRHREGTGAKGEDR